MGESPILERDGRIELPTSVWKTEVMPFYESRLCSFTITKTTATDTIVLGIVFFNLPTRGSISEDRLGCLVFILSVDLSSRLTRWHFAT